MQYSHHTMIAVCALSTSVMGMQQDRDATSTSSPLSRAGDIELEDIAFDIRDGRQVDAEGGWIMVPCTTISPIRL